MKKCQICHSKKVTACGARRLNSLFHTSDFTHSHYGKLSAGLMRAIFPFTDTLLKNIEQLIGCYAYKPVMVAESNSSDDVIFLCRTCGLWCKPQS